jgi:uncharacterized membrane protein
MKVISKSLDVAVPVSTAFAEWTRFEDLPRFLPGVVEVRSVGGDYLYWVAEMGGLERVWELEIAERVEDERVAWRTVRGPRTWGNLFFEELSPGRCRIRIEMSYDPQSFLALVSDYFGVADRWVGRSLEAFKRVMEEPDSELCKLPPAEHLIGQ